MNREAVEDAYERMINVVKGAAMMTETEVEVEFLGGCYNTMSNDVLGDVVEESFKSIVAPKWSKEDIEFVEKLELKRDNNEGIFNAGKQEMYLYEGGAINSRKNSSGSTDLGDVQHIVPTILLTTSTSNIHAARHSWQNTACAGNYIGEKGLLYGAMLMAEADNKIINGTKIVDRAKEEFDKRMDGKEYKCPIPSYVKVPEI